GGRAPLGLATWHPRLVRRLAISGAGYNLDAEGPEAREMYQALQAGGADLAPLREASQQVAPRPGDWPLLVEKCKAMWRSFAGWPAEDLHALAPPLLVM